VVASRPFKDNNVKKLFFSGVYAVLDLYGQCAQVTITNGSGVQPPDMNHVSSSEAMPQQSLATPVITGISHRFSQCCGKNVALKNNCCSAERTKNFNHGLVFSCDPLRANEIFEVGSLITF
jgi:neuralized-like protein 4